MVIISYEFDRYGDFVYFIDQNHQICRYIVLLFREKISTRMEGGDFYELELLE